MTELVDRVNALKGKRQLRREAEAVAKESKRSEMRQKMPRVAALVDELRGVFGEGVSVLAASEGGQVVKSDRALRRYGFTVDEVLR